MGSSGLRGLKIRDSIALVCLFGMRERGVVMSIAGDPGAKSRIF